MTTNWDGHGEKVPRSAAETAGCITGGIILLCVDVLIVAGLIKFVTWLF